MKGYMVRLLLHSVHTYVQYLQEVTRKITPPTTYEYYGTLILMHSLKANASSASFIVLASHRTLFLSAFPISLADMFTASPTAAYSSREGVPGFGTKEEGGEGRRTEDRSARYFARQQRCPLLLREKNKSRGEGV